MFRLLVIWRAFGAAQTILIFASTNHGTLIVASFDVRALIVAPTFFSSSHCLLVAWFAMSVCLCGDRCGLQLCGVCCWASMWDCDTPCMYTYWVTLSRGTLRGSNFLLLELEVGVTIEYIGAVVQTMLAVEQFCMRFSFSSSNDAST